MSGCCLVVSLLGLCDGLSDADAEGLAGLVSESCDGFAAESLAGVGAKICEGFDAEPFRNSLISVVMDLMLGLSQGRLVSLLGDPRLGLS